MKNQNKAEHDSLLTCGCNNKKYMLERTEPIKITKFGKEQETKKGIK